MNNLTIINNGQVVVSSRQIADNFEKEHRHVLETIRNLTAENSTVKSMFYESSYKNERGRDYSEYLMNRDGFSLLVMGFTGQKALEWKLKYIEAFNKMEKMLMEKAPSYQISDPIERAKVWIQEQEEKKALEGHIEELKPKALFADSVTASKTSILVGDLAKLIKQNGHEIGQNRLFEILRQSGFLIRQRGSSYNMPTQRSMDMELFEIKETVITHSDGHTTINKTPKVTGKGQVYFVNKFLKGELN